MIWRSSAGSFDKTASYLERLQSGKMFDNLKRYGQVGVDALSSATPIETGETSKSWTYEVSQTRNKIVISWINTHNDDGANIAILIQYGHATGTGGYVQGRDFINPAMRPVFDQILEDIWRQVRNG